MRNRSVIRFLSVLLVVLLLCALAPSAFAAGERKEPGRHSPAQSEHRGRPAAQEEVPWSETTPPSASGSQGTEHKPADRFYSRLFQKEMTPEEFLIALDAWLADLLDPGFGGGMQPAPEGGGFEGQFPPDGLPAEAQPPETGAPNMSEYDLYLSGWDMLESYLADLWPELWEQESQEIPPVTLPNPWTETESLEEATAISGVEAKLPGADALPQGMELLFYRAMNGILEADYTDGEESLMIRASAEETGYALSGDYNTYSKEWQMEYAGLTLDCLGDGESANIAVFRDGDLSYAICMAPGREGEGLRADALEGLLVGMGYTPAPAMPDREETALGDLFADACRELGQAEIGLVLGSGLNTQVSVAQTEADDTLSAFPADEAICVIEVSGQQLLDALEWAYRKLPEGSDSFLQVSGLSVEIRTDIESSCEENDKGLCAGIGEERRVKSVLVNGEALDPEKTYTVAGSEKLLLEHAAGFTAFTGATAVQERFQPDPQALAKFIADNAASALPDQGRIILLDAAIESNEIE